MFYVNRFEEVSGSIVQSLDLVVKYHRVFEREKVRKSLDRKFISLFLAYGEELEEIKLIYEREKQDPPLGRNLPPVTGNIQWSKHLLERCVTSKKSSYENRQTQLLLRSFVGLFFAPYLFSFELSLCATTNTLTHQGVRRR